MKTSPRSDPSSSPATTSLSPRSNSLDAAPAVGVAFDHLCKNFGSQVVLRDVTFTVKPGEIFVLMGPSGSGKSVLLKHIVGLELPTSGHVTVDGRDAADPATRIAVRIALVFQDGALFDSLSVYDNLALYPREHGLANEAGIKDKVMHALQILSMETAADKSPSDLSGGMKKRVAIARALVMEPQLMLYDEPTSELDPVMSVTISEIMATLKEHYHLTTIAVTHDRELALNIADRVGFLMEGRLTLVTTPAQLHDPKDPEIAEFLAPRFDLKHPRFKMVKA